jgi:hypothetical protein
MKKCNEYSVKYSSKNIVHINSKELTVCLQHSNLLLSG